jgi:hypothetical protein
MLLEVARDPCAFDDALSRKESYDDSLESPPPVRMGRRRAKGLSSCDKDGHITDSLIVDEDFHSMWEKLSLLEDGLSK